MATIGKVSAVFTASTSGLTAGVNQATRAMQSMQGSVSGLQSSLSSLVAIQGAQLFGSIASGAARAVSSLISMGQAQAEVVDQTSKLAARLGMTYAELAGLAYAGNLAGVSMDQIGAAATKADVAFVRASQGSRQAVAAFQAIGLSVADLDGLSAAERFDAIAAAIAALPTEAQRAAAAVQIFGRAGAELLPLFNAGTDGIRQAREEAERLGLTLTNAQGQNIEEMNDSFTRVQQAISGIVQQVTANLAPAISSIAGQFIDFVGSIGGANIGQAIGDGILQGARYFAQVADAFIAQAGPLWSYVSQVGGQWNAVWQFAGRVGSVLSAVGRFLQGAFFTLVGVFSGIGEAILTAIRGAADALGFDTKGLDLALATVRGFNQQINQNITDSFNAAGQNLSAAFADAPSAGEALAGPFTQTIDAAIAAAEDARNQVDTAARQPVQVEQIVRMSGVREAVQGIDSRSAEGVKEMFRIMRGGDTIQQQQLQQLQQINAGVAAMGDGGVDLIEADIAQ